MRAAAFTLFGSLSRFGNGPSEGPFLEQIQTNFVSLLVHLNEADPTVVVVITMFLSLCDAVTRYLMCFLFRHVRVLYRSLDLSLNLSVLMKCSKSIWIQKTLCSTLTSLMTYANL